MRSWPMILDLADNIKAVVSDNSKHFDGPHAETQNNIKFNDELYTPLFQIRDIVLA